MENGSVFVQSACPNKFKLLNWFYNILWIILDNIDMYGEMGYV